MRPCVVVTTYARPDGLARLLGDLERELPAGGLDVRVYDDATPAVDPGLGERLHARGWSYRRAATNHGKHGWWRWWNAILNDLRRRPAQLYYVLQDDMRLCERFFERSRELWDAIEDPRKASLYLHLSEQRSQLGESCWTQVPATRADPVVHTGWVDLAAFMCAPRLFDALDWRLQPIPEDRWRGRETLSSGVGRQLSVRAHARGLGLYCTEESLAVHDGSPSLMNAEARERWVMRTIGFVDGDAAAERLRGAARPRVFASLASIPARERGLRRVVDALAPQVDGLAVYLNGYERLPAFLLRSDVEVARSQDAGDRGDAGKFFWARAGGGYRLTCDDDIDYPSDYVARLVEGIERHGRRAVVGYHGSVLRDQLADYHSSRSIIHLSRPLAADTPVHVLGTGVAGYHSSAIAVSAADFPTPNMADIWLALLGQRQRVPFICLRRQARWLNELPGFRDDSVYVRARHRLARLGAGANEETRVARANGRWQLHGAPAAAPARPRRATAAAAPPRRRPPPVQPLIRVRVAGPARTATLVLPERDHITGAVQRSGTYYERDLLDAIRVRGRQGTFVDVGAHYGNHATYFGLECAAERVVAIEPSPAAFAGLLETVAENGLGERVVAHRVAVHPTWRHVAVTPLPWRPPPGAPARSNSGRVGIMACERDADAAAAPLDELLDGIASVTVLKVDTCGPSTDVLASGRRMLRRDRPLIAADAASVVERRALRALLAPLGYAEAGRYCWTATWLWEPRAV